MSATVPGSANPLPNLDQWEDFLEGRYKEGKSESDFRQYDAEANPSVAEFYSTNHEKQTVNYVLGNEQQYFGLTRGKNRSSEAAEYIKSLVVGRAPTTHSTLMQPRLQTTAA